jgi:hypothetical protein
MGPFVRKFFVSTEVVFYHLITFVEQVRENLIRMLMFHYLKPAVNSINILRV